MSGEYRLFNDRWYPRGGDCGTWIVRDGMSHEVHRNARGTRLEPGDEIHLGTDGHSLGGGMAQPRRWSSVSAVTGRTRCRISPDAIVDINNAGGFSAALADWKAAGDTFIKATVSGAS